MCRIVFQMGQDLQVLPHDVVVPEWVQDRASFDRWSESEEFPEGGRIDYLAGEIWIDMSKEQVFSHNQVKTELTRVLSTLAKTSRAGLFFQDGLRIAHPEADIDAVPDGVYILNRTFETMRVQLVPGATGGHTSVEGSPDMVLEVVSDSSVHKDTEELRRLYRLAAIPEYWLIDARGEPLYFEILRRAPEGYVAAPVRRGWMRSQVFGMSFRLTRGVSPIGNPEYTLETREK
jgi:Uma2 family endonuclease